MTNASSPRQGFMLGHYLLLGHLIGDFALQTGAIARMKAAGTRGLLLHVAIVTIVTGSLLAFKTEQWFWITVTIGGLHLTIDSVRTYLIRTLPPGKSLLYLLADQTAHLTTILAVAWIAAGETPAQLWATLREPQLLQQSWPILLASFVFLIWTVAVLEQEAARAFNHAIEDSGNSLWIDPIERLVGAGERLIMVSFVLTAQFLLIPLALLPRIFMQLRQGQPRRKLRIVFARTMVSLVSAGVVGWLLLSIT